MYVFDNFYVDCLVKLFASFLCGLFLGLERKRRFHSVGIRTLILISTSSMSMGMVSYLMAENSAVPGDPTRIAAGVVTGIGFIGGGAFIRQGMNIRGITSAAVIWAACGTGLACGIGAYFIAGATLVLSILSLIFLGIAEGHMFPAEKTKILTLVYLGDGIKISEVEKAVSEANLVRQDMNMAYSLDTHEMTLRFIVKIPKNYNLEQLAGILSNLGDLKMISIAEV
ncbi:MAG: MgtC/SapB family protein [Treponema sp.]|nr:MgtC/SapB family protein [Treponema sp.]